MAQPAGLQPIPVFVRAGAVMPAFRAPACRASASPRPCSGLSRPPRVLTPRRSGLSSPRCRAPACRVHAFSFCVHAFALTLFTLYVLRFALFACVVRTNKNFKR